MERREVVFRQGNDKNCLFFCMPPERYRKAVGLYLYGQLVKAKGEWREHRDAEGNFLGQDCLNEDTLDVESKALAQSFYTNELNLDYRAIPEYVSTNGLVEHTCVGEFTD